MVERQECGRNANRDNGSNVSDRLLTAREVADLLGVSAGALLRWTRAGDVPAVKLPSGAVRYRPEQIDAWLDEHATGAAERGVLATRTDRAQEAAYVELKSPSLATRSPKAAQNEEEDHAC
jgi:excisionase family DNA binding protein